MMDAVRVRAPGKINLFLEVGAREPDGYHGLATAFQAVSAWEEVTVAPADTTSLEVAGTVDISGVPLDERNLALRAVALLRNETGVASGVRLRLRKSVPVAGGMGGGSADAAAALLACDALWGTEVPMQRLAELAAELGADVPFGLYGGTAIGLGRGDRLTPALARGRFHWVIVPHDEGLSTPEVYATLDAQREATASQPPSPAVDEVLLHALRAGDAHLLAASVRNDLQAAALAMRPALAATLELGIRLGALTGLVSGSGPTLAFLTDGAEAALDLQIQFGAAGLVAHHVHGPVHGARVVG